MKPGDFYIYPNGTIVRITNLRLTGKVKVRAIKACVGEYSSRTRIGKPYTYQFMTSINRLNKRATRIGTEELLHVIFNHKAIYQ